MQKFNLFLFGAMLLLCSSFLSPKKEKINWITLEQLHEAYAKQPKPILVDLYTSWCGWCKVMDRDTYSKEAVASYVNEKYYAVKFNAEQKDSVLFAGKKYGYNKSYEANGLAAYLSYGQMSYPTTVFLTSIDAQPMPIAGFLKPDEIEAPLKYFGDDIYKTKTFPEFIKGFSKSW